MRLMHPPGARALVGGFLVVALAAVGVLSYVGGPNPAPPADATTTDLPPGSASLRAHIDPETGELVQQHMAEEFADPDLANALSRSPEGLVEIYHPDGHVSVDLQGRFQSASVARINADGKLETGCADTQTGVEAFLNGAEPDGQAREAEVQ